MFNISSIVPDNISGLEKFIWGIIILNLLNLWCIIDLLGYLLSAYIIKYTDIEEKYPRYKKIIKFFSNTNYIFIALELIYIIIVHIAIIGICLSFFFNKLLIIYFNITPMFN